MKLIRNARVYSAKLPARYAMTEFLESRSFTPPGNQQPQSSGFVEHPLFPSEPMALEVSRRFTALTHRLDTRMLPAAVVAKETDKRVKERRDREDRAIGRKERAEIKEQVIFELLPLAFVKTDLVVCFFDHERSRLLVPVASASRADSVVSDLIRAVGQVEMKSMVVDGAQHGISERLSRELEDSGQFAPFQITGFVRLERPAGGDGGREVVTIDAAEGSLDDGIRQAFANGARATRIGLQTRSGAGQFRLDHDFTLRAIQIQSSDRDDFDEPQSLFMHEAETQAFLVSQIVDDLLILFGGPSEDDLLGDGGAS